VTAEADDPISSQSNDPKRISGAGIASPFVAFYTTPRELFDPELAAQIEQRHRRDPGGSSSIFSSDD
jgi:hypothetical protein